MGEDLRGREEERPVCGGQEAQEEPSFKTCCCGQMLQVIEDTWSQPSFQGYDSLRCQVASACRAGFEQDFSPLARE